jgi:hypothetical protein
MLDSKELLKHYFTSIAFRLSCSIDSCKEDFYNFEPGNGSMTPLQLLNHISRLAQFCFEILSGNSVEVASNKVDKDQLTWHEERERIFKYLKLAIERIDQEIKIDDELLKRLIQGPISDIMTHIGQLAMLRRLSGDPMPRTYYFDKALETGKTDFE